MTDSGHAFPSGDPFVVYPGEDLQPVESLCLGGCCTGGCRICALQLLESLTDRATVEALIERELGMRITFKRYPHQSRPLLRLREVVNRRIERCWRRCGSAKMRLSLPNRHYFAIPDSRWIHFIVITDTSESRLWLKFAATTSGDNDVQPDSLLQDAFPHRNSPLHRSAAC